MTIDFNYTAWYVWDDVQGYVQVGCISAERQTCLEPEFLHAKPSKFHDQELEQVTTELNEILGKVAASSNGRGDLSILLTPDGLLLAWTQPSDTGTVLDDRNEIRKFLGYTF